jgi:hypothetical protein
LPIHKTNGQLLSSDISLILLIPIPEYAAASSTVKFDFSQIGTSFVVLLNKNILQNNSFYMSKMLFQFPTALYINIQLYYYDLM